MLDTFGNTTSIRHQLIDANQLQKLALTLGRPALPGRVDVSELAPPAGTPLPPGYHLVYFTPNGVESELGPDGTDVSFNAPAPFTRRMWAGGRMRWPQEGELALRVGDEAEERTRLIGATPKSSRSAGEMVLVEVEKEIWTPRGLAISDRRSWIFRPQLDPSNPPQTPPRPANADVRGPSEVKDQADGRRHLRWSPTGLFRFSALTFNGHKIHYNEDWTRNVEGHPGEVVHGPLNLINMLDYWRDTRGVALGLDLPGQVVYRAMSPIYAGEQYQIYDEGESAKEGVRAWDVVVEKNGVVCMKGEISI
jgi:hydroxyacyl-ACP dehydratase HTD2-like protein with hotdog domain